MDTAASSVQESVVEGPAERFRNTRPRSSPLMV